VIQINDKQFELFLTKDQIQEKIKEVAARLNKDYADKSVLLIVILNGSFMFASDLIKNLTFDNEVSFVKLQSYNDFSSLGNVLELIGLNTEVEGRDVVLIDDIVDTGITVNSMLHKLHLKKVNSVKVCSLLYKPEAFKGDEEPHYVGFSIPNKFVVGYGMDYNQKGRALNEIYQLKN
jgi:hypoxanthine phosphoribosyltransferase